MERTVGNRGMAIWLATLLAVGLALTGGGRAVAADDFETSFDVGEGAGFLAAGPDGAVWFNNGAVLGRIGEDGKVTETPLAPHSGYVGDMVFGPDGNFWASSATAIQRITPTGAVTEFPLPGGEGTAGQIVVGPDGNLWTTKWEPGAHSRASVDRFGPAYVVRVTPAGDITQFELPGRPDERSQAPSGIAAGPDGALWVADPALGRIWRVSTADGSISGRDVGVSPRAITAGPDGSIWFTATGDEIGRLAPGGGIRRYPVPGGGGTEIIAGPDGNLWFFAAYNLGVRRLTPTGQVSGFRVLGGAGLIDLAAGSDGAIWVSTGASPAKFITKGPLTRIETGVPGIQVTTTAATVRDGRVAIGLACGGSSRRCEGELTIGAGKERMAAGTYSVAAESTGVANLRLTPAARRLLTVKRFLNEGVGVSLAGGVTWGSMVVLRTPHPFRNAPRPGRPLLMPLPEGFQGWGIGTGPDGNLWLSGRSSSLTRITPDGELSRLRIPALERSIGGIISGPGGDLWFLEERSELNLPAPTLGHISPSGGGYGEISLPAGTYAEDLTVGPDGNLWIARTGYHTGEVDRVTPAGKITRFQLGVETEAITAGPGRAVWFTMSGPALGRIGPNGKLTRFRIPGRGYLGDVTAGPDGNLWYTHKGRKGPPTIGRMTPAGRVAEFPLRRRIEGSIPGEIVAGPDGNLWFTEWGPSRFGRITPGGKITTWRRGAAAAGDITVGPEGNIWMVNGEQETVAVVDPGRRRR